MREVSRREALAAGTGLGLAWTGTKYGGAWLRTGSVRCADLVPPVESERWEYGPVTGFDLTVLDSPARLGQQVRFRLRNVTTEQRETGDQVTYALQRRTEEGWKHVLFVPKEAGWPASVAVHDPGEGFTWTLGLTHKGLSKGSYHVCGDLVPGEYRFGYWGMGTEAIPAARFDVRGSE